jgi:phosphatidate cytidylyltransferase
MAFNFQTFKTRTLTAAVFVGVMLAGLLLHPLGYLLLFFIIGIGCLFEWNRLLKKIIPQPSARYWLYYTTGTFYIITPVLMLMYFRLDFDLVNMLNPGALPVGLIIPFGLILLIWTNDTMAYLVGSFFGKTPLSKISPKKTWEGTIGGALLTMCIAVLLQKLFDAPGIKDWMVFGFCASVLGTIGDLIESKIKRLANVKDSGSIMPGHGGFLDRFDSLLFATPFVWLYVVLFML